MSLRSVYASPVCVHVNDLSVEQPRASMPYLCAVCIVDWGRGLGRGRGLDSTGVQLFGSPGSVARVKVDGMLQLLSGQVAAEVVAEAEGNVPSIGDGGEVWRDCNLWGGGAGERQLPALRV